MNPVRRGLLLLLSLTAAVHAHGQPSSAADLAVGKDGSVRMHLQIPVVRFLWRQQAPQATLADFLTDYANRDDASLNLAYQRLQDLFAVQTHLEINGSMRVGFQDWSWPPIAELRTGLRNLLPDALSESSFHEVIIPLMAVEALAKAYRRIDALDLVLPPGTETVSPSVVFPAPEGPTTAKRPAGSPKPRAKAPTSPKPR